MIKNFVHLFPLDRETKIVDAFCGGGSVSLYLAQHGYKVQMNDLDCNLYNFWKKLKENPNEIVGELNKIWNRVDIKCKEDGEKIYKEMKEKIKGNETERAIAYYVLNRIVFAGMTELTTFSPTAWQKNYFDIKKINGLMSVAEALKNVEITNLHYEEIFKQDTISFYFLDPPYEIKDKLYKNHSEFEHQKFIDNLLKINNKFILTYNCEENTLNRIKNKYIVKAQDYNYCLNYKKDDDGNLSRSIKNEWLIYSV